MQVNKSFLSLMTEKDRHMRTYALIGLRRSSVRPKRSRRRARKGERKESRKMGWGIERRKKLTLVYTHAYTHPHTQTEARWAASEATRPEDIVRREGPLLGRQGKRKMGGGGGRGRRSPKNLVSDECSFGLPFI